MHCGLGHFTRFWKMNLTILKNSKNIKNGLIITQIKPIFVIFQKPCILFSFGV